jgi:hypothetical protein
MKTLPVDGRRDRRTDRRTDRHDEANSRFSQFGSRPEGEGSSFNNKLSCQSSALLKQLFKGYYFVARLEFITDYNAEQLSMFTLCGIFSLVRNTAKSVY